MEEHTVSGLKGLDILTENRNETINSETQGRYRVLSTKKMLLTIIPKQMGIDNTRSEVTSRFNIVHSPWL